MRSTYALSDFPYPADYPEWPSGQQVQTYLDSYARHFTLIQDLELNTEVTACEFDADKNTWQVSTKKTESGFEQSRNFDYLLVCNGIFSTPMVPDYPGKEEFSKAGGHLCHTSEFTELEKADGKDVLVVGYGKSSCDVAQALSGRAKSTTVIARHLIWKVPKMLMNVLNYKYLLLTRMGEGLFKYIELSGIERFLHGAGKPIRNSMLGQVQWVITKQCKLNELGLHPGTSFETIARSTVSLVTDGFFESVGQGKIGVKKGTSIERLGVEAGQPIAFLSNREKVAADIVVCGTGWHQSVGFLPQPLQRKITDEQGNFRLYRSMVPVDVPRLAFNGYNSSFFSQLNCEVGAMWLADMLGGHLKLPAAHVQNEHITKRLAWMQERTDGKHSKGTNIIPFSVHHIDELLKDMGLPLSAAVRFKQWLMPIFPGDFAIVQKKLLQRHQH